MAETFDTQLSDLHRKEADAEEKDYQERLSKAEDDYRVYQAFAEWVNGRGGHLVAKIKGTDAFIETRHGSIWLNEESGQIEGRSYSYDNAEAWQIIWDMWEAQLKRAGQ